MGNQLKIARVEQDQKLNAESYNLPLKMSPHSTLSHFPVLVPASLRRLALTRWSYHRLYHHSQAYLPSLSSASHAGALFTLPLLAHLHY